MVNGRDYEWSSLFARLDHFIQVQERINIDALVEKKMMREAMEALPQRIANVISQRQDPAARPGSVLDVSVLTELLKAGSRLAQWVAAIGAMFLLAKGEVTWAMVVEHLPW